MTTGVTTHSQALEVEDQGVKCDEQVRSWKISKKALVASLSPPEHVYDFGCAASAGLSALRLITIDARGLCIIEK